MRETDAAVAANRFGLGARPGELKSLGSGARDALRAQLAGAAPLLKESLPASHELLARTQDRRRDALQDRTRAPQDRTGIPQDRARAPANDPNASPDVVQVLQNVRDVYAPAYQQDMLARFRQAVASERSFLERLTHFWSNHFAVSVDKIVVLGIAGAMEREAIRPHVLGNFAEMLLAVEQHPAMLLYLDNQSSMGPNSLASRLADRRGRELGLNENLGREILELHTLGVDGGYNQQDVRALATIISGWSIGGAPGPARFDSGEPGAFAFREAFHEPGTQALLGKRYAEDGVMQGRRALADLALHPATARHLATKLARHFVADEPPAALVERVAAAYLKADGDLPSTYRALLDNELSWSTPLAKYKTPADYIHSAWRAMQLPVRPQDFRMFDQLGQRPMAPGSPAGWPDRSSDWDGGAALMKRLEWAQEIGARLGSRANARQLAADTLGPLWSRESDQAVARAQDAGQALALWLASPEFMRR